MFKSSKSSNYNLDVDRRKFQMMCLLASLSSLALRVLVPPAPGYGAQHDDELMVRMASNILHGSWLGEYADVGHLTLSKPAGFPLFLAWTHFLPWAPTVTVHIILLMGVWICAYEMRKMNISRSLVFGFVLISALLPQWYSMSMSRIYRDGFLASLTFLGLGLAMTLRRLLGTSMTMAKSDWTQWAQLVSVSVFAGITLSWSIATKPGWQVFALALIVIALGQLRIPRGVEVRPFACRLLIISVLLLLGSQSITRYIASQNHRFYGVKQLDTFSSGSYPRLLKNWTSVQSDDPRKYILVDASQRSRVYEISATAQKLRPFLELTWGNGWRGQSCSAQLHICDESATWFVWDLRDAIQNSGLGKTAVEFERSASKIADDIELACKEGRIRCGGGGIAPGLLPLGEISKRELADSMSTAFSWLAFPDIGSTVRGGRPSPMPTSDTLRMWDETIRHLPSRAALNEYRPEVSALGNTVLFLQQMFLLIWPLLLLASAISILTKRNSSIVIDNERVICLGLLSGLVLFVLQLALLESSTGMYLTAGKNIYLLSIFPYALIFIAMSLARIWPTSSKSK